MTLFGIDIHPRYQAGIDLGVMTDTDFVIVKASGGVGFNPTGYREMFAQAKATDKLLGLYHYAHENGFQGSADEEAAHSADNDN